MTENHTDDLDASDDAWYTAMSSFAECIVWFQRIEYTLSICISAISGMEEEIGCIVLSAMSFKNRVSVFGALLHHAKGDKGIHDDLNDLLKRLRWAEDERNTLVHSVWDLSDERPGTLLREKQSIRKHKRHTVEEEYSPEDFEELQELFEGINTDLVHLTSWHFPELNDKLHY